MERIVPKVQRFHALDIFLRATPTRWWETHKENMGNSKECARMMRLWFECQIIKMEDVYSRKENLPRNLRRWNQVCGIEPRLEWVLMFIHTLGKVPIEWYLETELHKCTGEWSALIYNFILTFSLQRDDQALIP